MINEILTKIDIEIEELIEFRDRQEQRFVSKLNGIINGLKKAKKIILAEQKKPLTKGDVIRESNESLAKWYASKIDFYACGEATIVNQLDKEKFLNFINQPQEDTK